MDSIPQEELEALAKAKPTWMTDGKGFAGDIVKVSNSKANLNWESTIVYRRPELNTQT